MRESVLIVAMVLMVLCSSCDKVSPAVGGGGYKVVQRKDELGPGDVEQVFAALGIRVERFRFYCPEKSQIRVGSDVWIDGQKGSRGWSEATYTKGWHDSVVLIDSSENEKVSFRFGSSSGGGKKGEVNTAGTSWSWSLIDVKRIGEEKTPVFVFAADKHGKATPGIDRSGSVETMANEHDRLFVLYMQVVE